MLAVGLSAGLGSLVYFRYGKEPAVDYDREYEQEPPTDLKPAEVGALLTQGAVSEKEFTATMFDLIRQGAIKATPSQVERSTWGGLRDETITDLVLELTEKDTGYKDYEQSVLSVVGRVLDEGPRPLHEFRDAIREDASENASSYQSFRGKVLSAIKRAGLLDERGNGVAWFVAIAVGLLVFGAIVFLPGLLERRPGGQTMAIFIVIGMVLGALALYIFLMFRRIRVRRSKEGALEAERWDAFRRYLTDFSRLKEAPPISLELWDRFLIYAIVFGVAEEVLQQARLHAPPELEQTSSIYWFGTYGVLGGPHRERLRRPQLRPHRRLRATRLQRWWRWVLRRRRRRRGWRRRRWRRGLVAGSTGKRPIRFSVFARMRSLFALVTLVLGTVAAVPAQAVGGGISDLHR